MIVLLLWYVSFFFSSRRRHTRCALVTGVQTCALPIFFRSNGTRDPGTPAYAALSANDFAAYRLTVTGRVNRPLALSLAQLRSMPARPQITRHDCVEGRRAIGKWTGPMLGQVRPEGRLVGKGSVRTCESRLYQ